MRLAVGHLLRPLGHARLDRQHLARGVALRLDHVAAFVLHRRRQPYQFGRSFKPRHQVSEPVTVVDVAEHLARDVAAGKGRLPAGQIVENDLGLLLDLLRVALAYLLQPARPLGVLAARAHLVDRLAQMAGRLQLDALVLETPVVDVDIEPGPQQMLVGEIGPVLAPLAQQARPGSTRAPCARSPRASPRAW